MGFIQQGTAAAKKYEELVERDIKLAASYGDLTALALAIAAPSSSTLDKVGAGINLVKFVEAFTALVKNIPIVSTAANSADLAVNAAKAKVDIDTLGYVSNANYAALLSSVTSITSGAAFTAAIGGVVIAGLSAPVLVAIGAAAAGVSLAASYYSSTVGYQDKLIEQSIAKSADDLFEGITAFGALNWTDGEVKRLINIKSDSPYIYPLVELIHYLSPSTTITEALTVVDASASGATLVEAVATLNAIRKHLLQLPLAIISDPTQYLAVLTETFDATKASNLLDQVTIRSWSSFGGDLVSAASQSTGVRQGMLLSASFYIDSPTVITVDPAALTLYNPLTGQGSITEQWLLDRSLFLQSISKARIDEAPLNPNGAFSVISKANTAYNTRYQDQASGSKVEVFSSGATPTTLPSRLVIFGTTATDNLYGGVEDDRLYGGDSIDKLEGKGGNDYLEGGSGEDTYVFYDAFGQDTITDTDGQGSIDLGGSTLGTFQGTGTRGVYTFKLDNGQYAGLAVYEDSSSSTGSTVYKAVIVKGQDTANSITINNFDLAAAKSNAGYLGIKLAPTKLVFAAIGSALAAQGNPYTQRDFNDATVSGSSSFGQGAGKGFVVYLSQAAQKNQTIVLKVLGAIGQGLQAILGDSTVDADGAVITLAEGQTQVSFALVSDEDISADQTGAISVSLHTAQGDTPQVPVGSNSWDLTLKDSAQAQRTLLGDQRVRSPCTHNSYKNHSYISNKCLDYGARRLATAAKSNLLCADHTPRCGTALTEL